MLTVRAQAAAERTEGPFASLTRSTTAKAEEELHQSLQD